MFYGNVVRTFVLEFCFYFTEVLKNSVSRQLTFSLLVRVYTIEHVFVQGHEPSKAWRCFVYTPKIESGELGEMSFRY
ncbi:hypothetical protein S83_069564 [Arachis hypogaea]